MYTSILRFIEEYLLAHINTGNPVTVGMYGSFPTIDLRQAAILLEPLVENSEPHSNVWNRGEFHIRIWIMVAMDLDYIASLEELEHILGAEDVDPLVTMDLMDEPPRQIIGLNVALKHMRKDPVFGALEGKTGGSRWRIGSKGLRTKGPKFGINVRSNGSKINTAQLDLFVSIETEQ